MLPGSHKAGRHERRGQGGRQGERSEQERSGCTLDAAAPLGHTPITVSHPVSTVLGMKITYEGPPALTGLFAQMLRDEGLEVDYQPPIEKRGGAADIMVAVGLTVSSTVAQIYGDEIKAAVRKLKDRSPHSKVLDENGKEIE